MQEYTAIVCRDGRKLCMSSAGVGSPIVLLEAGAGESSATWSSIWDALAVHTRVVRYDRAGLGRSDQAGSPRTFADLLDDLHAVISSLAPADPVLLVGHSLGGLLVQLYTRCYPAHVAGLVLLDAPHPDQMRQFAAVFDTYPEMNEQIDQVRRGATMSDATTHPEHLDFTTALAAVRAAPPLPDVPLVVISHGVSLRAELPDMPATLEAQLEQTWQTLQRDLARLSQRGVHRVATRSGHYVHNDEPQVVVDSIYQLIRAIRRQA